MRILWERYGDGEPAVLLLPTWSIVHSRSWKMQIPYLARHCRVVTFDGRGNGRSDRPVGAEGEQHRRVRRRRARGPGRYRHRPGDPRRPVLRRAVGDDPRSRAPRAGRRDRVRRPGRPAGPRLPRAGRAPVRRGARHRRGLGEVQQSLLEARLLGFLEFFFSKCFGEPHSTKQIEDCIGWALETSPRDARGYDPRDRRAGATRTSARCARESGAQRS